MKRRWRWLALVVATFVVGGAVAAVIRSPRFQKWYSPPILVLPADEEVSEMRASLKASQVGFEPVPEFVVPSEHVPDILGWLRPVMYVREPWRLDMLDELGEVVIRARDGRELRLRIYWAGKNPAVFAAGGEDQFYGRGATDEGHPCDGGIGLGIAIREAHKAAKR